MRFVSRFLVLPLVLWGGLAVAAAAAGTTYDLSALHWRSVGPDRGGRSQAVAGSAARPLEYYFGADGGGLWKTTDGGATWRPDTDGQIHSSSVSAVAVSASNPDIVYIGTGETALRGDIIQGDGVYKSTDAGKTWKHMGLEDTQAISRIRIDPSNPNTVYAAAFGHPYGPSPDRGVYKSTDGGQTWKKVLYRNDRCGAVDLVIDPHQPNVLYATIWDAYRTPWTLSSGGPGSGLFKSTDAGETWTEITRNPGLPQGILGKIMVTVGANSNRVYAMVEAKDGGLFQSNDAGATWKLVNSDHKIRQRAFYFSTIQADPTVPDRIYAMNVEFYRSDDGGKTFDLMHTPHPDHHDLWIASNDSNRMIAADDGGAAVSVDGGETWTTHDYPTAQFYHVALTSTFPYDVCGAQQDDGSICVPSRPGSFDKRALPSSGTYSIGDSEAGYVATDPKNPDLFYIGDQAGVIWRYDHKADETRAITVYPLYFSGMSAAVLPERWQWTFPVVFSPLDPNLLYTSSQHLFKTTDEGQHWESISPDLTLHAPKTLGDSGGPITKDQNGPEIYGTIFTIAPSRFDVNTIWTGSDDGLVYLTRDGGKTWKNVTPPGLGEFNRISFMDASPHDPGAVYLAAKRYQLDDRRPYIFKTHDYGKTWTKVVNGIPDNDFAQVVREDPIQRGLLYAGTEHGIYISFDDGEHWQSFSLNLPDTQVSDMAFARNDLVISTHGRGFYVLDNIGMLRQMKPGVLEKPAFLFAPDPAIRQIDAADIDYYLTRPARTVKIEILDAQGKFIRAFSSHPAPDIMSGTPNDPGDGSQPKAGAGALGVTAGTHRFTWDLEYPGATVFPGLIMRYAYPQAGPYAPPGKYIVRLTVDGQSQSQTLQVDPDPRLTNITDADMQQQFALAMQLRDATDIANRTVIQIRAIDAQIEKCLAGANDPALSAEAQSVRSRLDESEEQLYQVKNRSPRDTLNYPIKLNNQLATLEYMVDIGDHKPTEQDYVVYKQLKESLDQIIGRVDSVLSRDLKTLNDALGAHHLQTVHPPPR